MDKFEKHNDLASLLDDNNINKRDTSSSNRRGNFLSTLQRSKTFVVQENKNSLNTNTSEDWVKM